MLSKFYPDGEELDIKNADEEPDLRTKGENVLDTDFPPIGACSTGF